MINIRNCREYCENFLKIRTKSGELVQLRLNRPQSIFYEAIRRQAMAGKPIRIIALKARQMGISTVAGGVLFHKDANSRLTNAMIVAHKEKATANLYAMYTRFYDNLPEDIKPSTSASNAQELVFADKKEPERGLDSRIICATAGSPGLGRSDTINGLHISELAWWPGDKKKQYEGLMQSVPYTAESVVIIESTANGFDFFKQIWDDAVAGRNDFAPVFIPWFEMEEYQKDVEPGTVWTQEEREQQRLYQLTDRQMAWRRWCLRNNCSGDKRTFMQEYPACPEEAFLTSGNCYFDQTIILARLRELEEGLRAAEETGGRSFASAQDDTGSGMTQSGKPLYRGEFVFDVVYSPELNDMTLRNIAFRRRENGPVWVYQEPQKGVPYVLGGDTAGEGSDSFTAFCMDNTTAEDCAVVHIQAGEIEYTRQVYCLGQWYNNALVGIEVNFSTYPNNALSAMGYANLYVRQVFDKVIQDYRDSFGWRTDRTSRPLALAEFKQFFEEHPEHIRHIDLLKEMLVFTVNDAGRAQAMEGEHDDLVMGKAITLAIRGQQSFLRKAEKKKWTRDMIEDWNRANAKERREMERDWGARE